MLRATLLSLLLLAGAAAAQEPVAKEISRLRALAQRFVERGRPGDALVQLEEALAHDPTSLAVLGDILDITADDDDSFTLWSHYFTRATMNAKGKAPRLRAAMQKRVDPAVTLTRLRASALERLAAMARRLDRPRSDALARYLLDLARLLTRGARLLEVAHVPWFEEAVRRCRPDPETVLTDLERGMRRCWVSGKTADALHAARILHGACVQARRTKERVKRLRALSNSATRLIGRYRATHRAEHAPLTVQDLLAIPGEKRPAWEAEHADWAMPTVVHSPLDMYRVESICGVRSTAMAAADIEYHHRRLALWYGKDPFLKAQGTVRLCPTAADLEAEGQPFYWAGGFQGGNVTTITVNFADRQGMATTITHELTHRFDGAIYPGLPSWILEGRAVHTAACTLWPRSDKLDERAVSWGSLWHASYKGYGRARKLKELIEGTIEDYRDNYAAGYSLWIYLSRYRQERFGPRIERYLKSFKAKPGRPAIERFESFFVDGRDGRPKTFGDLAKDLREFFGKANALDAGPWKKGWQASERAAVDEANQVQRARRKSGRNAELADPYDRRILDHSNHPVLRGRSDDPLFGERHALAAAHWFDAHGMPKAALRAFVWARAVDDLTQANLLRQARFHRERGAPSQAWLLRLAAQTDPGPVPADVAPAHAALAPFRDGLRALERQYGGSDRPRAARAMRADRIALERAAGMRSKAAPESEKPRGVLTPPPDCDPYLGILARPLVEDVWDPAETVVRGNWHVGAAGLLVLGRRKTKTTISGVTRDAGIRKVFVRGTEWFEGTYTFRVRVKLISAHLGAGIVIGHTRGDRGLVVNLGGGDWAYAVGRKDKTAGFRGIHVSLNDLRGYDGGVSRMRRHVSFRSPKQSFLLTVRVSDAFVRVRIDDRDVLSHRSATDLAVRGRIGFLLGSGLVAFQQPEVRRHRVVGPWNSCPCEHGDEPIDLSRTIRIPWETWQGRRVLGVPHDPLGSVLLCYPDGDLWKGVDAAKDAAAIWRALLGEKAAPLRLHVLHPTAKEGAPLPWGGLLVADRLHAHAGLPSVRKAWDSWIATEQAKRMKRRKKKTEEEVQKKLLAEVRTRPPWLMVDPRGVVRYLGLWIQP
ncbi:MAG: hypothetical protein ACYTGK_15675, partial [Planctomycetota bacterium]